MDNRTHLLYIIIPLVCLLILTAVCLTAVLRHEASSDEEASEVAIFGVTWQLIPSAVCACPALLPHEELQTTGINTCRPDTLEPVGFECRA